MAEGYQNNPITLITKYDGDPTITVNTSFGTDQAYAWKTGNIVTLSLRTYNTSEATSVTSATTLFTLPIGYRPIRNTLLVGNAVRTTDFSLQDAVLFEVQPSGIVHLIYSGSFYQLFFVGSYPVQSI